MLLEARKPVAGSVTPVALVNAAMDQVYFKPSSFDLIYCMGVFGSVLPLTEEILVNVTQWLKPGGRFCFDVIQRFLTPSTGPWKTRYAENVLPYLIGPPRAYVEAKLAQFSLARSEVAALLKAHFKDSEIRETAGKGRADLLCTARI